jgi:hypothetical protein
MIGNFVAILEKLWLYQALIGPLGLADLFMSALPPRARKGSGIHEAIEDGAWR